MRRTNALTPTEIAVTLAQAPVLSALGGDDVRRLAESARVIDLGAHDALWTRDQPAELLGFVVLGRLKLMRHQRRRELIVEVIGPGDLVGDVAFPLQRNYQYDVVCLRRSRVIVVPTRVLRSLLEHQPKAAVALALNLAEQVLRLTRRVEALTAGNVEHRLARVLIGLVDRFGEPFPGGVLVPLRLRREDLASLAATTLESTSRQLSAWKRRNIIVPQPAGYLVRDLALLRALIEQG
jgi:CRP/FNR family transcriptional regulator